MSAHYISEVVEVLKYADGELFLAASGGSEQPARRLREADIVFIRKSNDDKQPSQEESYVIYSLEEEGTENLFRLRSSTIINGQLPDQLLSRYLLSGVPKHLTCDANNRLSVVVSTNAGVCQAEKVYKIVLRPLLAALGLRDTHGRAWSSYTDGDKYELIVTESDQTVKDLGRQVSEASAADDSARRTIVLLSGDGGVVDLLNGPDGQQMSNSVPPNASAGRTTIALLPLGTGNALFHSLHKPVYAAAAASPSPYVAGLRTLFSGEARPLPTFEARFAPGSRLISYSDGSAQEGTEEERTRPVSRLEGAIVASYGFHASLVWESDTPEYRRHGAQRFHMAAAELLKLGHGYEVDVEVCGGEKGGSWKALKTGTDRFGYVLATLVSSLEKTFTISPASAPLDGRLRVVTFGDVGGEKTMDVMRAAYDQGSHVGMGWTMEDGREERVGYEAVEEVKITVREENGRWRKVCVDGTIVELPPRGGWMRVGRSLESRFSILVDRSVV